MNKKIFFLIAIGSLLFSSCAKQISNNDNSGSNSNESSQKGNGGGGNNNNNTPVNLKEISSEEATSLLQTIKEKAQNLPKPYRFEMKENDKYLNASGSWYEVSYDYIYAVNADDDFYYSWENKSDNHLDDKGLMMRKKDANNEEISYVESFEYGDGDEVDTYVKAVKKKDNEIYDFQSKIYISNYADAVEFVKEYMDAAVTGENVTPEAVEEMLDYYSGYGYSVTATFKADNNGNMDITVITALDSLDGATTSQLKRAEETLSFRNYYFKSLISNNNNVDNGYRNFDIKMYYESTSFALPNDWQNNLVNPGSSTYPASQLNAFLNRKGVTEEVPSLACEGANYEYYTENNSWGEQFYIRVFTDSINTTFGNLFNTMPETWDTSFTSFDGNTLVPRGFTSTSPNGQLKINVEMSSDDFIYLIFSPQSVSAQQQSNKIKKPYFQKDLGHF